MNQSQATSPSHWTSRAACLLLAAALAAAPSFPADAKPPSATPLPLGDEAKLFSVPDLDGKTVDLAAVLHGKVALIAMWASWCQPCIEEIPKLRDLARTYRDRGLVVVGVGLEQGGDTPANQRHVAARQLVNYLLLFDADRAFQTAYKLHSLPFTLLVGTDGKIAWQGAVLPGDLETRVQALLKSAPGSSGQGG